MPKISVIVPVYNVEVYLHHCLDSILAQTFTDYELILVDDGSPDNCGAICDEYATKDRRIHVIHQSNGGLSAARNAGLDWVFANSDSKWISFIDSDDWVHPRFLELLYEGVIRFDVNISQCGYLETNGTEKTEEADAFDNIISITPEEQYLRFYSAFMWNKLFSRSCWQEKRFPVGQIFEDVAVWYKILFKEKQLAIIENKLYYYYINPEGIFRKDWTPAKLTQINAWEEQLKFAHEYGNKEVLHEVLRRYCWVYKHQSDEIRDSNQITEKIKKKYKSKLIRRFRWFLIQHQAELKIIGILQIYGSWAFPGTDKLYWTLRGIGGRIKRKRQ